MATGQYLTEVARRLVERGHQVTVVTSRRAYDHPESQFPKSENWQGIRIYRVGSTGFGKDAKWRRAADFASFIVCCCARLLLLPSHDRVVALTTPPLISFIGACIARFWGASFFYWVMDFNPDEAIAAGWLRPGSFAARLLEQLSRFSLRHAKKIIALDRFMRDRIVAKGISPANIAVIPPWSHDTEVQFDPQGRERFRRAHGLNGKFVVMYSGNHSPVHPLDTLLQAAEQMRGDPGVVFCFVGGGSEWRRIRETTRLRDYGTTRPATAGPRDQTPISSTLWPAPLSPSRSRRSEAETDNPQPLSVSSQWSEVRGPVVTPSLDFGCSPGRSSTKAGSMLDVGCSAAAPVVSGPIVSFPNILCLPYQPLDQLAGSLSAADLHVVVMGNQFVGLVHPCKIYNIFNVGAPVLYIGPNPSHVSELLEQLHGEHLSHSSAHGDVDSVVRAIADLRRQSYSLPRQAPQAVPSFFSREAVLPRLIAELESV